MTSIKDIYKSMEYGPAPESHSTADQWLDEFDRKFGLFINGQWVSPSSDSYFESINPANEDVLAQISESGQTDISSAVEAARKAQPQWWSLGHHDRAKALYAIARQIQKHARLFAVLETMDNGKPLRESRDIDIPLVARHFYHHAGWAQVMDTELQGYKPVGVVGQIIPWNFPLLMLAWKVAPALAMGNTVVLKPAEFTSLTALLFADICKTIGIPDGVINIVTGGGKAGQMLVQHPDINKIAFTGSTEVGRIIRRLTAGTGKKISLELGGKSPFIVFDDADIDSAVEGVVDAIWFNQGQVCCAGSRLLVQEGVADRFLRKLKNRMAKLRVGDPLDKSTDIGAIVAPVQLNTIKRLVQQGVAEGCNLWQPEVQIPSNGYYYPPTLFTDVSPSSTVAQQEIFGPVLVTMTFRTPSEAVALANNTRYGLAASIWSENINLALDVAPKIKAGTVWINCTNVFDAASGFGGYRESGFGREGGKEGLVEYCNPPGHPQKEAVNNPDKSEMQPSSTAFESDIDLTPKLYIGGKQVRPDGGYSLPVYSFKDGKSVRQIAEVGEGNRKDIRNAVEAAHKAAGWTTTTAHNRAQVLFFIAENLSIRTEEFVRRLSLMTGSTEKHANEEVQAAIDCIFRYAAYADKYDGNVHATPMRNVTLAMPEPLGVMGIVCPNERPLMGFISVVMPTIAMGNRIIVIPSKDHPLSATDFYQVLNTSDLPGGVVNIVTGRQDELAEVLAKHDDVDGVWYFGSEEGSKTVEFESAGNMKRTWVNYGRKIDWLTDYRRESELLLRKATQIKNIWIPYGE